MERSSNGVMEEGSGKTQKASTYALRTRESNRACKETVSNGVMDECSGKVPEKAGTHVVSSIVMYLAVVEIHHCAAAVNPKASALPNKEGRGMSGKFIQWGDG